MLRIFFYTLKTNLNLQLVQTLDRSSQFSWTSSIKNFIPNAQPWRLGIRDDRFYTKHGYKAFCISLSLPSRHDNRIGITFIVFSSILLHLLAMSVWNRIWSCEIQRCRFQVIHDTRAHVQLILDFYTELHILKLWERIHSLQKAVCETFLSQVTDFENIVVVRSWIHFEENISASRL